MSYPTTYLDEASEAEVTDLAGKSCLRLTSAGEVARRLARLDDQYIRSCFVPLDSLADSRAGGVTEARDEIAARRLPQPAYRLDDGTDMVAEDFFAFVDAACDLAALPDLFRTRYAAAANALGLLTGDAQLDEQWADYLTGG